MAQPISWRKLSEYNDRGDQYLLIVLDAMWLNKKMKVHNKNGEAMLKAAPEFDPETTTAEDAKVRFNGRDVKGDMESVLNDEMTFDDPNQKAGPTATSFKQRYMGKTGRCLRVTWGTGKKATSEDILFTGLEKTSKFGGGASGSGGGSGQTEKQESAACWLAALRYASDKPLDEDDLCMSMQLLQTVQSQVKTTATMKEVHDFVTNSKTSKWLGISIATANLLYDKYPGTKNQYKFYRGESIVDKVEEQFYTVNSSHVNETTGKKVRPFANLNKWSPADIYMVTSNKESTIKTQLPKKESFGSLNSYMTELILSGDLIGVSLKGFKGTGGKISEWNYDRGSNKFKQSVRDYTKVDTKDGLFDALDVYIWGTNNMEIQFRSTDTEGSTWQGEVLEGTEAKHGKIGGGVFDKFMKEVATDGKGFFDYIGYKSVAEVYKESIKTDANGNEGGALPQAIYDMVNRGSMSSVPKHSDKSKGEVPLRRIQAMGHKWIFSKFLGLKMGEKLKKSPDSEKFMTLVFRYATSQADLSGPFDKIKGGG